MRNKLNKIVSFILTTALVMIFAMTMCVYAEGGLLPSVTPQLPNEDKFEGMTNKILGTVLNIGSAVAAGMMIYVGIKYVMASANEKADLKVASIRYVIGALILFSAATAYEIVENLMLEIGGS